MRHRAILQEDAPYGAFLANPAHPNIAAGFTSILTSSVDGLSGYLSSSTALSPDRLRLLSLHYLSLQQYVATESSFQRGNPFFIPSLNLRSTQLPPICIYFPQSVGGQIQLTTVGFYLDRRLAPRENFRH